jgi:hypothetical protein
MKRFRTWLEGLPGGHRPPTGPLTTDEAAEAAEAEELRQKSLAEDDEPVEHEREDAGGAKEETA